MRGSLSFLRSHGISGGDTRRGRYIRGGAAVRRRAEVGNNSNVNFVAIRRAVDSLAVQQSARRKSAFKRLASTTLFLACAVSVGFVLLVIMFKLQILEGINVLFYRGVVLIGIAGILTFVSLAYGSRWFRVDLGMAFSAALLSMSINLTFLVIFPVTIDRSISVFLLAYMEKHPDRAFTASELRSAVSDIYVGRYQQIDRRVDEQLISRNVSQLGGSYKISAQGRAFVTFARVIAWMFDTDPRLISGEAKAEK